MKKDLKDELEKFLTNFNAREINHYFACDFYDDWDNYYIKNDYPNIEIVLQYLNDAFIDIDVDYRDTKDFDGMVKRTLEKALKMLD